MHKILIQKKKKIIHFVPKVLFIHLCSIKVKINLQNEQINYKINI